jgi:hypothetical protein
MTREAAAAQRKQPYEKPALRTISLVAEEVLAIGCKLPTSLPILPIGANCLTTTCSGPGS